MEKLENSQVKLTITVSAERFAEGLEKAYKRTGSRYTVAGFRKGRAPRKVIENYYGEGVFWEEAFREVYPDAYMAAINENNLDPVDMPEIDIEKIGPADGVLFTALVTVRPEVTLGEYKGIKIEKKVDTVTDEQIDQELARAAERVARFEATEEAAAMGDRAIIDFTGYMDGEAFEGGAGTDHALDLGAGQFIPGFEEQVVGMKAGETKEIEVSFPEDYWNADFKGKPAKFSVTVKEVQKKELPEMDDEFAKDVSSFETLAEYREDIRHRLTDAAERRAQADYENALIETVTNNATVEIPPVMIDNQIESMIRDMEQRLAYQGLKMEDYLSYTNTTIEQMREQARPDAERTVRIQLVIDAIRTAEKVEATPEDLDAKLAEYAERAKKDLEEYKKEMPPEAMGHFAEQVLMDKLLKVIAGEE